MNTFNIKSPYPYFGGKSRVASIIWQGMGQVSNYVEPFAGSLAVLLANPVIPKIETVNDKDNMICNFWRAVSNDPEGVAKFADYPVMETDLHARQRWLSSMITPEFHEKMEMDIDYYDVKMAGYWIWGMGASIGDNWLRSKGLNSAPLLSSAGSGIHGLTYNVLDWFKKLQERTRRVRVCCGDWTRVVKPSVTYGSKGIGPKDITGVFLDPPYDLSGRDKVYMEDANIFGDVYSWAVENGTNPRMRIVLCGYDGKYKCPEGWQEYSWQANGGLSGLGDSRGKDNKNKERIWFNSSCLKVY
jgi:site-specific DNA-adenine methylase